MKKYVENLSHIIIKDLEIEACHGVNPEEKTTPQRWLVSIDMCEDILPAAQSDDIDFSTSYAKVSKLAVAYFKLNCFNLIEKLSDGLATEILQKFPLVSSVEVEVKKPDAPMKQTFDYVSVKTQKCWTTCYLALGSSLGNKSAALDFAIARLNLDANVKNVKESARIASEPYGGVAKERFLNSCVRIDTLYTPHELLRFVNQIEADGGRVRGERWADRTLDIDIVFYGAYATEYDDLVIPHRDMCSRSFVLEPLCQLCPNFVHPLLKKRVSELAELLK